MEEAHYADIPKSQVMLRLRTTIGKQTKEECDYWE